jgi:hypothetical protein
MNQTTESQATTATKVGRLQTTIIWLIILACGILIPTIFFRSYAAGDGFFLFPFPWVIVGGMTIDHGLTMFSGKIPELPTITTQLGCLVSILTVFVICPTLFFFGLRTRAVERAAGKEGRILRWSTIQFVLGGMVMLGPALLSIPVAIIQRNVSSSLHESQAPVENKYAILYELNSVAVKLHEYRILPREFGGGNGSFAGFTLPKDLESTTEAQYKIELQDTLAIAKATSVKYPLGTITARISKKGRFLDWKYSELFE